MNTQVSLDFGLERCRWQMLNKKQQIVQALTEYGFKSLVGRLDPKNTEEKKKNLKKEKPVSVKNNLKLW